MNGMKKANDQNTLVELINHPESPIISYINLDKKCVEIYEDEVQVEKHLVRIPFKEELVSYTEAVGEFIEERDLSIPRRVSAKKYLIKQGYIHEFYDYWNNKAVSKLKDWLEKYSLNDIA